MTTPIPSLPFLDQYARALDEGDADRALDILLQAREDHPASGETLALLAAQHMQMGAPDAAEAAYIAALQLSPDLATTRFQLGLLQYTSGRPQTAFQTWHPLESLGESHYLVLFKRAFATLAIDAFEDTLRLLDMGMAANQENAPLNHDMRMLVGQIEALRTHTSDAPQDEAATQFVLASYKQNL
ncbi:tetratricopeptide repeat protein [Achromobacter sp. SLBN-14]|uniref:tetratricopeptide repeat protein n=1 Tax=Achromobacter sp. SLBN-14 TaxID=2768442 RepID=UPI001154611F|nr:tetratricopeptide repeat protein [Achromobacter sp. SLBN-14]TQJ96181.1 tetratricopeptide repeat protein [Achromobacter sp. SLBN-14]